MVPVYCIWLVGKEAKAERTRAEFQKYGVDVTLFRGTNGQKSGLKASVELHHNDGYPYFIGPHHIGIILSHLSLWNHLVTARVSEALIVQDDVKLCPNFLDEFEKSYSELPSDWEYVWVGHCCASGRPATKITERVFEVRWPMCDHCILVKLSGLEKMLEPMNEFRAPLDMGIIDNVFSKGLVRAYTFLPGLALQHDTNLPL